MTHIYFIQCLRCNCIILLYNVIPEEVNLAKNQKCAKFYFFIFRMVMFVIPKIWYTICWSSHYTIKNNTCWFSLNRCVSNSLCTVYAQFMHSLWQFHKNQKDKNRICMQCQYSQFHIFKTHTDAFIHRKHILSSEKPILGWYWEWYQGWGEDQKFKN